MAKHKKNKPSAADNANATEPANPALNIKTVADLRQDPDLWYRVKLLVYDLHNIQKDKTCQNRTHQTTDATYISSPYFSASQAAIVKTAIVNSAVMNSVVGFAIIDSSEDNGSELTVEEAISSHFANFFEKRRASGDFSPCGPHDMAPAYLACFGLAKADIEDEAFVSRVRRSGLKT